MNARGILTAAYHILHLLTKVGYPPVGVPPHPGPTRGRYPTLGTPQSGYTPLRVPPVGVPPSQGTPSQGTPLGYPPVRVPLIGVPPIGVPPCQGTPLDLARVPHLGVDRQIDGWTDTCQNITFPSYYVRGR